MWFRFVDEEDNGPGIGIKFLDPPQWDIGHCTNDVNFYLPSKTGERVWTVRKETGTLKLSCDGEEIFSFNYTDTEVSSNYCTNMWSQSRSKIKFMKEDNASDKYRAKPGGKQNQYLYRWGGGGGVETRR